ncbi:hypothetical protein [Nocardia tengchongensis]|uniref:hypothetical protein n=1 Tax=Nocardia tengchongensis TaxID=2055889 RepID=UPI00361DBB75
MSSAAERLKAQAERAAAARAARAGAPGGGGRSDGAPAKAEPRAHGATVRQKPIRRTVDLPPEMYRRLVEWQGQAADTLGKSRVTSQDVFVALVYQLLSDPKLENSVLDRLGHN